MLKKTLLQHFVLASILQPYSYLNFAKHTTPCLSNLKKVSQFENITFKNHSSTWRRLEKQTYLFQKQGIPQLVVNKKSEMETDGSEHIGMKVHAGVRGMKELDKTAFDSKVKLPCIVVEKRDLQKILYVTKPYLLKIPKQNTVIDYDKATVVLNGSECAADASGGKSNTVKFEGRAIEKRKVILLNPKLVKKFKDFKDGVSILANANITEKNFGHVELKLTYDNFSAEEILKAILPNMISSFTSVGHIVQCNLREDHADYRFIIGQVLLDKVPNCKTVVNKVKSIDNTFRNFDMDLLAGKNNMITIHKENGCTFKMDFSKVYWNSRLSTEHSRVIRTVLDGSLVLDVFAGVGPFSIPSARRGAYVVANDLNPDSITWLQASIELNKKSIKHPISVVQKDAREFLQTDAREHLLQWIRTRPKGICKQRDRKQIMQIFGNVCILMNLPASAIQYVKYLRMLTRQEFEQLPLPPILFLYVFLPKINLETKEKVCKIEAAKDLFKENGLNFPEEGIEINFVRNVAPNKDMHRVEVYLGAEFLVKEERGEKREGDNEEEVDGKKCRSE